MLLFPWAFCFAFVKMGIPSSLWEVLLVCLSLPSHSSTAESIHPFRLCSHPFFAFHTTAGVTSAPWDKEMPHERLSCKCLIFLTASSPTAPLKCRLSWRTSVTALIFLIHKTAENDDACFLQIPHLFIPCPSSDFTWIVLLCYLKPQRLSHIPPMPQSLDYKF